MTAVNAMPGKFTGFGLVRDKDGNPKIDDFANCPAEILAMLTKDELESLQRQQRG